MKKLLLLTVSIVMLSHIVAQVPKSFKYQAVVRDASGQILANKLISLRLSILEGQDNGPAVYSELYEQYATNEYGIAAVNVGNGVVVLGNFNNIQWGEYSYYLKVELDINGQTDFVLMGTSQILAVPYALYALDVMNNDDADADPANEIQDLQLIDNVLKITKNAGATEIPLSQYIGVDTDDQRLSVQTIANTVQISIEDGNSISFDLPTDFVSKSLGGTFGGNIYSSNIQGPGILSLQGNFTVSGSNPVQLISAGTTSLNLPTSGTLVNENYVSTNFMSKSLLTGRILVGEGGFAVPLDAYENGYILIGNGTTVRSRLLSGDGSVSNMGTLTVSRIGNVPISLGGNFTTTGALNFSGPYNVSFTATGTTNINLPTAGTLATEGYVTGNFMPLSHPANTISGTNISNWNTAYGWGNHASAGYLTSYTETDPVFIAHVSSGITGTNISNWNTAYGWGNHASAGYLTSYTETDPVFIAHVSSGIAGTNISNWNTAYGWGNHASAGYLTSYTETDPVFIAHVSSGITGTNISNWNTAYGWGNHASAGYLTSYTETDPVFIAHVSSGITGTNISNWNTAYGWGNHASAGYLTSYTETDPVFIAHVSSGITGTNISNWNTAYGWGNHAGAGYLTSYTETDPVFIAHVSSGITGTNISNWNTAYGWGNHAGAGYLTSYTETDPVFIAHVSSGITGTNISNWNTAYGWGNHAGAGYLTSASWASPGAIGATTANSGSFTSVGISTILNLTKISRPTNPDQGDIYFDNGDGDLSRDGHLYIWDGSVWRQLTN